MLKDGGFEDTFKIFFLSVANLKVAGACAHRKVAPSYLEGLYILVRVMWDTFCITLAKLKFNWCIFLIKITQCYLDEKIKTNTF